MKTFARKLFLAAALALPLAPIVPAAAIPAAAGRPGDSSEVQISRDRSFFVIGSELSLAIVERDMARVRTIVAEKPELVKKADKYYKITPLHEAAAAGLTEAVELLVAAGADVNAADSSGQTPLCSCADAETAKMLIAKGARADVRNRRGETPLHVVSGRKKTSPALVEFLVSSGLAADARDGDEETPLFAAASNSPEMVSALLAAKADPNARDSRQETPLHRAVRSDNPASAGLLLAAGAAVDAVARYGGPPIFYAESTAMVELLARNGADVNSRDRYGNTPLFNSKKPAVIASLVRLGADPNAQNAAGATALADACLLGRYDSAKALVDAGTDALLTDASGRTAIFSAASFDARHLGTAECSAAVGNAKKIVDLLLSKNAELNMADRYGQTPIFGAVNPDVAEYLASKGAKLSVRDDEGRLPIHSVRNRKMAEFFVSKGLDANAKTPGGYTPLILSVMKDLDLVEYLVEKGADVNATAFDKNGGCVTPLLAAIEYGNEKCVELLVRKGAKVNFASPGTGDTPLHAAAAAGNLKAAEFLVSSGADQAARNFKGKTPLDAALEKNRAAVADMLKKRASGSPGRR